MSAPANVVRLFKRAGVISGPSSKQTRHSDLSVIKTWLIGDTLSFGYKAHNNFGSATHHRWLLKKFGRYTLAPEELQNMKAMVAALEKHPIATKLLASCTCVEKRFSTKLDGVPIGFTPDAWDRAKKKLMLDLKTTVCRTLADFVQKAFEYGYFRQGRTYMVATGVKTYYLVGIQKAPPYNVYIVWLQSPEFIDWMDYVNEELKFLLYFYQNYGSPSYKKTKS